MTFAFQSPQSTSVHNYRVSHTRLYPQQPIIVGQSTEQFQTKQVPYRWLPLFPSPEKCYFPLVMVLKPAVMDVL